MGAAEVKAHPWLADIDWANLATQQPLFVPAVEDDADTANFQDTESAIV